MQQTVHFASRSIVRIVSHPISSRFTPPSSSPSSSSLFRDTYPTGDTRRTQRIRTNDAHLIHHLDGWRLRKIFRKSNIIHSSSSFVVVVVVVAFELPLRCMRVRTILNLLHHRVLLSLCLSLSRRATDSVGSRTGYPFTHPSFHFTGRVECPPKRRFMNRRYSSVRPSTHSVRSFFHGRFRFGCVDQIFRNRYILGL